MTVRYPHLLSPLKVGNLVLRNRMISGPSTPHFLQGVEPYPTEKIITHFANRARSGAAVININHMHQDEDHTPGPWTIDIPPKHFNMFDMEEYSCHNYVCQLLDAVHFYGANACVYLSIPRFGSRLEELRKPPQPSDGPMKTLDDDDEMPPMTPDVDTYTKEDIAQYIAEIVDEAVKCKRLGFDMASMHSAYRLSTHSAFLSPLTNHRTDEYGGPIENRARFTLELFQALRQALGKGFPLECVISVSEPEGGNTVEDICRFAELADGLIDIIHLRNGEQDPQHPVGFTSSPENPTPTLEEAAIVKRYCVQHGLNIVIGASGGFTQPDIAEQALAEGKCDLIYMARAWICDPEFGRKVREGRPEDITPCIRCNKCHVPNGSEMYRSLCSVNPILGIEDKVERMYSETTAPKKVAIVGAGPAGLRAAMYAADRGHNVTVYEASNQLGGQLLHSNYAKFKWPLKRYMDWLVAQVKKRPVTILTGTVATRQMLEQGGYEKVILALGAKPNIPNIPGADQPCVLSALDAFGAVEHLADQIVIIGGGEVGVEVGMYLCDEGKQVTVLEMGPGLAADAPHAHYKTMLKQAWKSREPAFHGITRATVIGIGPDGVSYQDRDGLQQFVPCGNVVLAVGTHSNNEHAIDLFSPLYDTRMIGDCFSIGALHGTVRSAFAAAMEL